MPSAVLARLESGEEEVAGPSGAGAVPSPFRSPFDERRNKRLRREMCAARAEITAATGLQKIQPLPPAVRVSSDHEAWIVKLLQNPFKIPIPGYKGSSKPVVASESLIKKAVIEACTGKWASGWFGSGPVWLCTIRTRRTLSSSTHRPSCRLSSS